MEEGKKIVTELVPSITICNQYPLQSKNAHGMYFLIRFISISRSNAATVIELTKQDKVGKCPLLRSQGGCA